jgi:ketosteroid isomerase-like protein
MDAENELLERWAAWQHAIDHRDGSAAAGLLADDFALVLVQPARAVVTREQWLAMLPDYVISAYEVQEEVVEVAGDVATVLHRDRMQASVMGADRSGIFVITDVWRRYDGVWKMWRRHSTPMTAGAMPSPEP